MYPQVVWLKCLIERRPGVALEVPDRFTQFHQSAGLIGPGSSTSAQHDCNPRVIIAISSTLVADIVCNILNYSLGIQSEHLRCVVVLLICLFELIEPAVDRRLVRRETNDSILL